MYKNSSAIVLALLVTSILPPPEAEARGFALKGSQGGLGGFQRTGAYGKSAGMGGYSYGKGAFGARGGSYVTPKGGTYTGASGGFVTPNQGAVGRAFQGTTGAGGTYQGAGGAAWKKGVGGAGQSAVSGTAANGSTYSGYKNGRYDAQTGQGTYSSGKTYNDAVGGQQYGYSQDTQFAKGQGGQTTIDTQNKGDYTVDWQQGQKPVVTQTAPSNGTVPPPAAPPTMVAPTAYQTPYPVSTAPATTPTYSAPASYSPATIYPSSTTTTVPATAYPTTTQYPTTPPANYVYPQTVNPTEPIAQPVIYTSPQNYIIQPVPVQSVVPITPLQAIYNRVAEILN